MKTAKKATILNENGFSIVTIPARDGLRQVAKLDKSIIDRIAAGECVLTDTATAYLDQSLEKMSFQALTTRYAKSGNFRQLQILWTAKDAFIRKNNDDYKQIIENMYESLELSEVVVHETVKITAKWVEIDEKTGKKVERTLIISIPTDKWEEIKWTQAGKEYIIDTILSKTAGKTESCVHFDDVLMAAWEAAMELENFGLLVNFDSIWCLKSFIYRRINQFLDNYSFYSVSVNDDTIDMDRRAELAVMDDDTKVILTDWAKVIKSHDCKRFDSKTAFICFILYYFYGYTQNEISTMLKIESQSKVSRMIAKTKVIIEKYCKIV